MKIGPYTIEQLSEYRYKVTREDGTVRFFTDGENGGYKYWLEWEHEDGCASCGKRPCKAHHEPPVGRSGRDHAKYWYCALPLCAKCHKKRHDGLFNKAAELTFAQAARDEYPVKFLDHLFNIIGHR